ncbi:hypothetical protein AW736_16880 [Termitidicoccus mucosus]|uniref:Uncharacterized protein n=1 Tax=Termitidicoccus mucosus TaxID=1184151 RepID=A0A178IH71_9BACT|nr:hypothetical protein AW736_16880 [Opitutaceae bacterium TSB47]
MDKLDREDGGAPAHGHPPTETVGAEPRCLRLAADNTRAWELPWASFYGAVFTAADARDHAPDRIELSFARYEAVLRGKHLAKLMDGLHAMRLAEVRAVEEKFLGLSGDDGEPVVVSVEVKKLGP